MKPILLLLLLIPFIAPCQQKNKHCYSIQWGGACVTFLSDRQFTYERGDCTSNWVGKGCYKLSKTRLKLHFQKDTTGKDKGGTAIEVLPPSSQKSSRIEIDVVDKYNNRLIDYSNITLVYDTSIYIGTGKGTMTDENSHATFEITTPGKWALRIYAIGYNSITVPVSMSNDYKIKASLTPAISQIPSGKTYTFRIKRSSDDFEIIIPEHKHIHKRKKAGD